MGATLGIHYVALGTLLFVLGNVIPGYQQCFERLGLDLTRVAIPIFHLSDLVVEHWYTLILAALIFDPPIVGFLTYSPRLGRLLSGAWNTTILLGTVLVLFFALLSVYLPLRGYSLDVLSREKVSGTFFIPVLLPGRYPSRKKDPDPFSIPWSES
ncbi:MAG: hypothetical protein ACC628_04770 [Pirellulaceae bacterium]